MGTFFVTSPQGQKFKVNAPEGASEEQIIAFAQKNMPQQKASGLDYLRSFTKGIYAGGSDEVVAGMRSPFTDKTYSQELSAERQKTKGFEQQHPIASGALEFAGSLLPSALIKNPFAGSALYGALTSEGGVNERITGGVEGGVTGAIVNRLLGVGGNAALRAGRGIKNVIKPDNVAKAERKVVQRLADDGISMGSATRKLRKADEGRALIDVGGENTQRLGEAVGTVPGRGAQSTAKFVDDRTATAPQRIKSIVSGYISNGGDVRTISDDVIRAGQERAKPLYDAAYKVDFKPSKKLQELSQRPALQRAEQNARRIAANEGADFTKLSATQRSDYVKRGLDDVLEGYRDKTTGRLVLDQEGRAIKNLRSEYVKEIDRLNPSFAKARGEAAGYIEDSQALKDGQDFLNLDPADVERSFSKLNRTQKELYRLGVADTIRQNISSSTDGVNIARKVFGTPEKRARLQRVLGHTEFRKLEQSMKQESEMFRLNQKLTGNSRTKLRDAELADLNQDPSDVIEFISAPKRTAFNKVSDLLVRKYQGLNREVAGNIADMLYETDPIRQKAIMLNLTRRAAGGDRKAVKGLEVYKTLGRAISMQASANDRD